MFKFNFEKIGENIERIRKEKGMTKRQLAQKTNLKYATHIFRHIKTGKIPPKTLQAYAGALGCTMTDLTEGVVEPPDDYDINLADVAMSYPYNLAYAVIVPSDDDTSAAFEVYVPELLKALKTLPERSQSIILMHYRDGMSLSEIGEEHGISAERARQIEHKAFIRIRHPRYSKKWLRDTEELAKSIELDCEVLRSRNNVLKQLIAETMHKLPADEKMIQNYINTCGSETQKV